MDIKPRGNAVIVVRSAWASLPLVKALLQGPQLTNKYLILIATVADSTDFHGLVIEIRDQEDFPKQRRLLIPWSQILAVYWSPEMAADLPTKQKIGFTVDLTQPRTSSGA